MIIKNTPVLATTNLRKSALEILEAGLAALQTPDIMRRMITRKGSILEIQGRAVDLSLFSRILVVGFGKAAIGMGSVMEELLGDKLSAGIILDRKQAPLKSLQVRVATHPNPSEINAKATEEIISLLKTADRNTLVIVLVSGGGSAMLTAPYKMSVEQKASMIKKLMDAGATIQEINVVRKHISRIKGGRLVQLTYPAKVITLILSDVIGDDMSVIASGPTVYDPSTVEEAEKILARYELPPVELTESPKDKNLFEQVEYYLLGNVSLAIPPMEAAARKLGFETKLLSTALMGDANSVGKDLLEETGPGEAVLAAGETTLKVAGTGTGGRNQQLVLQSLPFIAPNKIIAAVNTDGHDNSDRAGALGDAKTLEKAKEKNIDPETFAVNNNSYAFFTETGDGIETGELESNFADIVVTLAEKK